MAKGMIPCAYSCPLLVRHHSLLSLISSLTFAAYFSIVFNLKERKVDFMRHFQVKWNLVWGMACAWLLLVGCTPGAKRKLTMQNQAIGLPFEVVVVQEEASWKSSLGDALLAELESPYPALPQPEAFAKVSHCTPDEFTDFMRSIRNVVWVDVDTNRYTKPTLRIEKDVWANGQQVFRLQAPSASALEQYVHEAGDTLRALLREEEQRRYATYLEQYHSSQVDRLAQEYLGLSLYVPEELDSYTKDSAFVWASNDAASGRMDIVLYAFPASGEEELNAARLVAMRDSILGQHIAGSFEGSYMSTEKRFPIVCENASESGAPSVYFRGLWRMEHDMMGGPFVARAFFDEKNRQIVVAEGFIYAPETTKKMYVHRLESALRTARLFDATAGES